MPARNYYVPGDWNAVCDRCGFKFKASELREDWQGLRVCEEDYEERHPLDFLRAKPDKIFVPWTRIDPSEYDYAVATPSTSDALGSFALGSDSLGGP